MTDDRGLLIVHPVELLKTTAKQYKISYLGKQHTVDRDIFDARVYTLD